ncbi:hypothetical protein [Bacteroides sp.]|uniref:hypothetical protein n=1 Tax=Bacteroides sp. TaxID=29523 RepID=UPI002590F3C5|nr:hypothetical protein [Bacteroides sp.]
MEQTHQLRGYPEQPYRASSTQKVLFMLLPRVSAPHVRTRTRIAPFSRDGHASEAIASSESDYISGKRSSSFKSL